MTCINLEDIMLSEIRQTVNDKNHMISRISRILKKIKFIGREYDIDYQGLGSSENVYMLVKVYRLLVIR